ncbi:hypothetical protein M422DRAFT_37632 [Sphaerobolus stellatus SS14]|uniref:Uncharacterized protein n=1 Tax=Sphaerobolus stellatus (strain SS14) TaxID=990650 RepID=A0A0C9TEI0_SPHS4|nr:hypothetical protein M422DRAFT_37632 [Sphaerobolus stellatus SS14]
MTVHALALEPITEDISECLYSVYLMRDESRKNAMQLLGYFEELREPICLCEESIKKSLKGGPMEKQFRPLAQTSMTRP